MYDIAVLGNSVVDALIPSTNDILDKYSLKKSGWHLMPMDQFLDLNFECDVEKFESGGSTANTAFCLSRLGHKMAFISKFGEDPAGRHFHKEMTDAGIQMPTPSSGVRTMEVYILITPDGQRTFACPGTTAPMAVMDVNEEAIRQSKWLLIEGYLLLDQKEAVDHAIKVAKENDVKIALTLGADFVISNAYDAIAECIERGIDLLISNKEEEQQLYGDMTKHEHISSTGLTKAIKRTPRIITNSGSGATFYTESDEVFVATTKIDTPVDVTGAGDAFAAGFLFTYTRDGDVKKGMTLGHTLARNVIMQTGARLKDWGEVLSA